MEWSKLRRELRYRSRREERLRLYTLGNDTLVTYVRMSCTVVIAVVVRLFLDCLGIIVTGQDPQEVVYWFGHCKQDVKCIVVALLIFLVSLSGCSFFAWSSHEWILDPDRNPYAKHLSFKILLDACSWVPISVGIGKTNALVEVCMGITQDDVVQMFLSSAIAAVLTLICALLTHFSMKHVTGVARHSQNKDTGFMGYVKFLILTCLGCLGWAVGWCLWAMVMALLDALQPGRESTHTTALVVGVISLFVLCTTSFYLKYGPEPVIPDPILQQLCYSHGYSSSVRRAFISYLVYACMVFLVMCCVDPTYGLLHVVALKLKAEMDPSVFGTKALIILLGICIAATILATFISAAITRITMVDMESSMKLSRSAHETRKRLSRARSDAELLGYEQMMRSDCDNFDNLDDVDVAPETPQSPTCEYSSLELQDRPDDAETPFGAADSSENLKDIPISKCLCASVLLYDVLAFMICALWGIFAVRTFYVVFGYVASTHNVLYVLSSFMNACLVAFTLMWGCLKFFPSMAERNLRGERWFEVLPLNGGEEGDTEIEVTSPEALSDPLMDAQDSFAEVFEATEEEFLEVVEGRRSAESSPKSGRSRSR